MPAYTIKDMKTLASMSADGSIASVYLPDVQYSPRKFKDFLLSKGLRKDVNLLFDIPLKQVALLINKGEVSGYVKFRFQIGK
jgi:hypothetical protein